MDATRAELEVEAETERLDHDLRLLHGLCAEISEALEGTGQPAHQEWKHLQRQSLGVFGDLQPGAVDGEELEQALARLRAFKARLLETHPHLALKPQGHSGAALRDDP